MPLYMECFNDAQVATYEHIRDLVDIGMKDPGFKKLALGEQSAILDQLNNARRYIAALNSHVLHAVAAERAARGEQD